MSDICYPDSLIGSIPNLYYYAANNPSEATIAKRRSYANTISYLTPPAENAGLYKGLKVRGVSIATFEANQFKPQLERRGTCGSCSTLARSGSEQVQQLERQLQQHEQAAATKGVDLQHCSLTRGVWQANSLVVLTAAGAEGADQQLPEPAGGRSRPRHLLVHHFHSTPGDLTSPTTLFLYIYNFQVYTAMPVGIKVLCGRPHTHSQDGSLWMWL